MPPGDSWSCLRFHCQAIQNSLGYRRAFALFTSLVFHDYCTSQNSLYTDTAGRTDREFTPILLVHRLPEILLTHLTLSLRHSSSNIFTATDLICRQSNRLAKIPKETIVVCKKIHQKSPEIEVEIIQVCPVNRSSSRNERIIGLAETCLL